MDFQQLRRRGLNFDTITSSTIPETNQEIGYSYNCKDDMQKLKKSSPHRREGNNTPAPPPTPSMTMTETNLTPTEAAVSAATTIANHTTTAAANFIRNPTKRSLSESFADDFNRTNKAVNRSGGTKREMWDNEMIINPSSTNAQPQRKRSRVLECAGGNRNHISDMIDVGIRIGLVILFIFLETTNSFKRKIHMEEMWLYKNPRMPDIVTPATLILSVIFGPLFITLIHLQITRDRRDFRAASWVWTLALGLNGLVTSLLKITVGRHRPDFFYRCFPDGIAVLNDLTEATLNGTVDIYNCTGNIRDINEGRKSFPSGHASFAFVGFGFIAIYIGAKLHALSPRGRGQSWRLLISMMPLLLATLVAVSRTCDYHHHWQDVVAGGVIGICVTYLVYRQYYPSIFSPNCHQSYPRGVSGSRIDYYQKQIDKSYTLLQGADVGGDISDIDTVRDAFEVAASRSEEYHPLIYER